MYKSFSLLLTLFLVSLFSLLAIFIVELSNLSKDSDAKNLLYFQALNHLRSSINLISQIDIYDESKECIDTLVVDDDFFDIRLEFSYISKRVDCSDNLSDEFDESITKGIAIIDIFIKPKSDKYNIKLHKKIVRKLE